MPKIPEEWLKRLTGRGAPNPEETQRQIRILAFYLGNLFAAIAMIFWMGVFDSRPAALIVPVVLYVIGRIAVEGWPPSNPHDLRALARVAERYGVHHYLVVHAAALTAVTGGVYAVTRYAEFATPGARFAAAAITLLVALVITLGHLAVGMMLNFMALRLELRTRKDRDPGLGVGPHTLPDGHHLNIVDNPSETIH
ncbi:MAG: hypothetical protein KC466_14685 [Myxococcales bacterium]|nr:hypothetical protein [Myxococcales bacterium]